MWSAPLSGATENTGPRLRGPGDAVLVLARRDRQRVREHQRAHVRRILVAQQQVGDLVVEQRVLAARRRLADAVQQHRADAPRRRVVVAVRVPADRPVRVRNELAALPLVGDRHPAHAVVVGQEIAIEAGQAELAPQRARQVRVGVVQPQT